ncbi:MAG: alpha/beta fold hydrolase, partial [Acidobacteria bacterium]|nr:alpha/beta fold hydrolase [Acidobacteriota bacterium]
AEGNKVRPLDEQELTDMRNVEVTFKDKLAPGSYTVHYELRTAGGALALEESRAFLAADAAGQRLARLRGAFDALPPAKSPGQAAASESIEYILTLLERATREYAGDAAGVAHPLANRFRKTLSPIRAPSEPFHLHRDLDLAEALAADLRHGRKPFAARTGDLRLAYRSSIDNTLQPFRLFVPAGYAPSKNWPLIVALHGAGGDENAYFDRYLNPANGENLFKQLAQERGYLGVAPNGRGQYGMYVANSEKDVLEVIDRVLAVFRVDPKQVYLTGHSMGGMGTFGVGFRHAGRFQALAPVAGAGNLAGLPLDNAPDMPVLFSQGAKDTIVTPESSRAAAAIARKKLANFDYREHPDDDHFIIGVTSMRDVFDFFDARRKRAAGNGQ